jgi:hypothetical protein
MRLLSVSKALPGRNSNFRPVRLSIILKGVFFSMDDRGNKFEEPLIGTTSGDSLVAGITGTDPVSM